MEKTNFEKLRIYHLANQLADNIWEVVIRWNNFQQITIGKQLVTAADSIGANIAEGSGRGSVAENKRFAKIARGSLFEVKHWLNRVEARSLMGEKELSTSARVIEELVPKLSAYINSIK